MAQRQAILNWCQQQLAVDQFHDYCPNGLQVAGCEEIRKLVCAVSASQAAIDFAIEQQADMLLVHHGMFWKNEVSTLTGWKQHRLKSLLMHDINLAGYHLPLDAHMQWGNNVQLAKQYNWQIEGQTAEQKLLMFGQLPEAQSLQQLASQIEAGLQRTPLVLANDLQRAVKRLAWCTGGAQGFFQQAIDLGVDVYITGEVSEPQYHLARETGVAFIAAGHHATERYGVQALAQAISQQFAVQSQFFDEANPA